MIPFLCKVDEDHMRTQRAGDKMTDDIRARRERSHSQLYRLRDEEDDDSTICSLSLSLYNPFP